MLLRRSKTSQSVFSCEILFSHCNLMFFQFFCWELQFLPFSPSRPPARLAYAASCGGLSGEKGKNCSSKQKNWKNIKLKWENKIKHEKTDWRVLLQVITQVFSINRNRYGALSILVTSISTIYVLCYWFDVELDNSRIWVGYLFEIGNLVFVQLQTTILYRLYLLSTGYLIKTLLVQHVRDPGLARHW